MPTSRSSAPVIAAIVLLLPVLYVVSYLALVIRQPIVPALLTSADYYRLGGGYAKSIYWPLEQLDRRLQPGVWLWVEIEEWIDVGGPGTISSFESGEGLIIDDQDPSENLAP
jgi:hypothetical protein